MDAILDVGQESRLGQGPSVSVRAQSFQASMLNYFFLSLFLACWVLEIAARFKEEIKKTMKHIAC